MVRLFSYAFSACFLLAALSAGVADCGRSVALAALRWTSALDFLANFGLNAGSAAPEGAYAAVFLRQILYYTPIEALFLPAALLFWRLSFFRPALPALWRYKMRQRRF